MNLKYLLAGASALGLVLTLTSPACAQSAPAQPAAPANEVSDVVVTGRFIDTGAASATKQNLSTLDTPFSVSAYTGNFMAAINTTQVADLYRYMTGLQKAGATGYDLTLRGFSTTDSDRNTILVDGLPGLAVRFGSPPTVGTDHIEIVKGAASLLYGAVQPGGFVNMISKKPQHTASTTLSVRDTTGASDRNPRAQGGDVSVDSTGPLNASGSLTYRFVGQVSRDNTFRDNSFENGNYVAPSLTWEITDNTTATLEMEYRSVASNYASLFLLAPRLAPQPATVAALAPITTNYMSPSDFLHEQGLTESVFLEHRFGNGVKWNFSFRNVGHQDTAHAFDIVRFDRKDPTFQTLTLRARGQRNSRMYTFGDTYLTVPFKTGEIDHRMIVGVSLGREVDDFQRLQYCAINSPDAPNADASCNPSTAQYTVSVQNPDFSKIPPLSAFGLGVRNPSNLSRNYVPSVGKGAYISDLITFSDHWKALVGVRYAHENQTNFADKYAPGPQLGDAHLVSEATLPQAGLIYEPTKELSFYASYSTSFSPVPPGTQDVNGSFNFAPTRGQGYEVGAKGNLLDGRVTVTAALFRIDQTNVIVASSSGACSTGSCSEQIGAARSEGLELEASGKLTANWTVIAGYAHTNARITENNDLLSGPVVGGQLPNSPLDAAHLWSRYDIASGPLEGLGIGVGLSYVSSRIAYSPTRALPSAFVLPSYKVMDLGLYYPFRERFNLTLKINNLLDEKYFSSGIVTQGKVNVQPGLPRTALATISYTF